MLTDSGPSNYDPCRKL